MARLAKALGLFSWAYMPIGLCALAAVGVHAAADVVDDRLLWAVDHIDSLLDGWLSRWPRTESLVHLVGPAQRILLARVGALAWELVVDVLIAVPLLGYKETPLEAGQRLTRRSVGSWALFTKTFTKPTVARILRPLSTAAFVVAGACAIARMVHGALYLSLRAGITDAWAGPLARGVAVGALVVVLARFGLRAVMRSVQHADAISEAHARSLLVGFFTGWAGSVVVVPLALIAVLDAAPLLSFFR